MTDPDQAGSTVPQSSDAKLRTRGIDHRTALVTGASRGIGASVATQLAAAGVDVGLNFRTKAARAQGVAEKVGAYNRSWLLLQADLTVTEEVDRAIAMLHEAWISLDLLILNASGGLETDRDPGYAERLNLHAQVALVQRVRSIMPHGGRIVLVTSHLAHFHGTKVGYEGYNLIAASKRGGEDALRAMVPDLACAGIKLVVVSGDLIEGTITPTLLQLQHPGLIEARRKRAGKLPNVEQFATAIVHAALDDAYLTGDTIYVGSTEWG